MKVHECIYVIVTFVVNNKRYNYKQQSISQFKMQVDRNFSFLCSVDTKKFSSSEVKKQVQSSGTIQVRNSNQKATLTQICFNHSFLCETLITNVQVVFVNNNIYQTHYQSVQIQVSLLSSRGNYAQLVNFKSEKQQAHTVFSGAGLTHSIKISFLLKNQVKKKSFRNGQKQYIESLQKIITESIKEINLYGVCVNSNPSPILLTKLLNISQSFKKYNLLQEAAETDILVSLSLISARRFVQAAQILRKVSKFYVQKYNNNKSIMDLNRSQKSWIKDPEDEIGLSTIRSNFGAGRILEGSKFLQRAAKIQLLIAQTISHPSLVLQKLQSYHRCNAYSCGNVNPIPLSPDIDLEDISITMFPQIVNFLLKVLSDKLQPLRIAAIKSIQFFIQTLGCSIGNTFIQILKQVINTYPYNFSPEISTNRIPYGLQQIQINHQKQSLENIQLSNTTFKNKILMDHYHHLLETLLTLMSQINRRMIISIFGQIILPSIMSKASSYQLKLYLLRFSQKSISISGADLNIQASFIGLLLRFCEQKNSNKSFINTSANKKSPKIQSVPVSKNQPGTSHNKQVMHNLVYFSHKILTVLKSKVLPRYSGKKMQSFLQWINKTLTYLGQNQMLSNVNSQHSTFVFTTVLDFVISMYSVTKYDIIRLKMSPIQTILYFANLTISNNQGGLPFDKIIQALVIVLRYHSKTDSNFQLNKQIISRVLQKSKQHNLSLKQLQLLIKLLDITDQDNQVVLQWLEIYLGCIPHSTYDQTYQVFCLLFQKSIKTICNCGKKPQILNKIVNTMLDQYTVKGKAHQQAKQTLIFSLIKNSHRNIIDLLQICLFNNVQPKTQNYYSKRKAKGPSKIKKEVEHHFDSKGYRIDIQLFIQKISLAQLILTKICLQNDIYTVLMEMSFVQRFFEYMKVLTQNSNLKLKSKALSLINHYLQITLQAWKKQKINLISFIHIVKNVFGLSKIIIQKLKQSKIIYSTIFNLMNLCRYYEIQPDLQQIQKIQEGHFQKLYQQMQELTKNDKTNIKGDLCVEKKKGQRIVNIFILKQFLKIWPILAQALYSPWENVRQIYIILIIQFIKEGLLFIPQILKKKLLELVKPIMFNLFTSTQHSERQAALKIFGSLLGLRLNIQCKDNKFGEILSENFKYLKPFAEKVYEMTFDWDEKNVQIAQNLCQICLSQQTRVTLNSKRTDSIIKRINLDLQNSFQSFNLGEQMNLQRKNYSMFAGNNNLQNLLLKQSWFTDEQPLALQSSYCPKITQQLLNKITQFKSLIQKQIQARTQIFGQKQSFMQQNQEQFYDMGQQKAQSTQAKQKSQDDQLQFEDLGIIELDDEQWGQEQQKQEKILQKLPIKKIYKLSPSVLNSSKPQRIRSKRFHQNQFDYREKIIVDQLQEKIGNDNTNANTNLKQNANNALFIRKPIVHSDGHINYVNLKKDKQENNDRKVMQWENQRQKQRQRQRQRQKQRLLQLQKQLRLEKRHVNHQTNLVQPLIIDDFDFQQENIDDELQHRDRNDYKEKQKSQKKIRKQNDKEHYVQNYNQRQKQKQKLDYRQKQKQTEKKPKKGTGSRKRKQSIGK